MGSSLGLGLALIVAAFGAAPEQSFVTERKAALRALAKRDFSAARQRCRRALAAVDEPKTGGTQTAAAHALCGRVERAADRPVAAAKHYKRAAWASVDAPKRRRGYLAKRRSAHHAAKHRVTAQSVTKLLQHDAKVHRLRVRSRKRGRAAKEALKALLDAHRAYRQDGDRQQARLAQAVRALVLSQSDKSALAKKLAQRVLRSPAPALVEQAGLRALYHAHTSAKATEAAAQAAIRLDEVSHAHLLDDKRRYRRGRELQQACRALDAQQGAGACVRLQLKLRGYASLTDHSRRKSPRRLTQPQLQRVHGDALVTLEYCVLALAKADPERYRDEELHFNWSIQPDGRPSNIEVRPRRHTAAAQACIDDAVSWFRYPRTPASAERTNVSVPYRLQ